MRGKSTGQYNKKRKKAGSIIDLEFRGSKWQRGAQKRSHSIQVL